MIMISIESAPTVFRRLR